MPEKTHSGGALVFSCGHLWRSGWNRRSKQRKFKLDRWAVTQGRVESLAVIDLFEEPFDAAAGIGEVAVLLAIHFLIFQGLHERLAGRVVVGISASAHADAHAVLFEESRIIFGSVLHATVGMMGQPRRRAAATEGHF